MEAFDPAWEAEPADYNGRAVRDVAELRFDAPDHDTSPWIAARIVPDPGTGEAWLLGGVIDSRTGKFVNENTGTDVSSTQGHVGFKEKGSWTLAADLEKRGTPERGRYDWEQPVEGSPYRVQPSDLYDVFSEGNRGRIQGAGGGLIVTRYDGKNEGGNPFRCVHVVPEAWHNAVAHVFEAFQTRRGAFATTMSTEESVHLLASKNPLEAVAAIRRAYGGHFSDLLLGAILAARGYRRAAFVYVALIDASNDEAAFSSIQAVVTRIGDVEGQRSVVAGIGAAGVFSAHPSMKDVTRRLRDEVRSQLERVRGERELDQYLLSRLYPSARR
jgi:hypothetical protein